MIDQQIVINEVTNLFSFLTVMGNLLIILLLSLNFFASKLVKYRFPKKLLSIISHNSLTFSLTIAVLATLGSLFFSEFAKYEPCKLCWFQRIFMYPQTILLAIATAREDKNITSYLLPLNLIGMVIAAYHYYIQINPNPYLPCSAVGYSQNCSQTLVLHFGYVTIPMMSFTAFAMITLFLFSKRHLSKKL
jgi:disulfide bond formation protein DsbB